MYEGIAEHIPLKKQHIERGKAVVKFSGQAAYLFYFNHIIDHPVKNKIMERKHAVPVQPAP